MLYAVLYVSVNCVVVCGCAVSRRYINVCNSDVSHVVNVISPPPALCNLSVHPVVELCTLGVLALGVSLVSRIVMTSACVL